MSIPIKEIAFVFHPVTDIARARKFYEDLLGLKTSLQVEFGPGQWWIEYDIAGQALAISNAMPDGKPLTVRFDVVNLFDTIYQIRSGTGIGVFAPQFGPRRGYFIGISKKI